MDVRSVGPPNCWPRRTRCWTLCPHRDGRCGPFLWPLVRSLPSPRLRHQPTVRWMLVCSCFGVLRIRHPLDLSLQGCAHPPTTRCEPPVPAALASVAVTPLPSDARRPPPRSTRWVGPGQATTGVMFLCGLGLPTNPDTFRQPSFCPTLGTTDYDSWTRFALPAPWRAVPWSRLRPVSFLALVAGSRHRLRTWGAM